MTFLYMFHGFQYVTMIFFHDVQYVPMVFPEFSAVFQNWLMIFLIAHTCAIVSYDFPMLSPWLSTILVHDCWIFFSMIYHIFAMIVQRKQQMLTYGNSYLPIAIISNIYHILPMNFPWYFHVFAPGAQRLRRSLPLWWARAAPQGWASAGDGFRWLFSRGKLRKSWESYPLNG